MGALNLYKTNTSFYLGTMPAEALNVAAVNNFAWKSNNFADAYWFLHDSKVAAQATVQIKA
jgi:hypothetical protein